MSVKSCLLLLSVVVVAILPIHLIMKICGWETLKSKMVCPGRNPVMFWSTGGYYQHRLYEAFYGAPELFLFFLKPN
jgi:hypothetical protein